MLKKVFSKNISKMVRLKLYEDLRKRSRKEFIKQRFKSWLNNSKNYLCNTFKRRKIKRENKPNTENPIKRGNTESNTKLPI